MNWIFMRNFLAARLDWNPGEEWHSMQVMPVLLWAGMSELLGGEM